jgi:hypothetical protein
MPPPAEVALSLSDQIDIGPPLDVRLWLIKTLAVDLRLIEATELVLTLTAPPIVRSPAVAVIAVPVVPSELMVPVVVTVAQLIATFPAEVMVPALLVKVPVQL